VNLSELSPAEMATRLSELATEEYEAKEKVLDPQILRRVERDIMLQIVDAQWKDHLYSLDHLKEGIGLRGYGQRDPLVEYKRESFELFQAMKDRIDEEMVRYLWRLRPVASSNEGDAPAPPPVQIRQPARKPARTGGDDAPIKTVRNEGPQLGRNDPCWCGSGKKFKKCHGA
jgi:preprotein translocase subunit SecA